MEMVLIKLLVYDFDGVMANNKDLSINTGMNSVVAARAK